MSKQKSKNTQDQADKDATAAAISTAPKIDWQFMILAVAFLACALAFLPTTLLFFFGMMPTLAALVVDPTPDRIKTMAVGAMNLAGVVPFLLELWTGGNAQSVGAAFTLVAQANTIITMYGAAAVGYLVFYTVSGFVATMLLQKGRQRIEDVKKRLVELERKWGREVTGAVELDERGFPIEDRDDDL